MPPQNVLPIDPSWPSVDTYVNSLLTLVTTSDLLRNLCGGAHILDFLTREPDLYMWVLPEDWRNWFELVDVDDLLDLLLREPLDQFQLTDGENSLPSQWRGIPSPPTSLVAYIDNIRCHCLNRSFQPNRKGSQRLPRRIEVGMKPKKIHEVVNFAAYVDELSSYVSEQTDKSLAIIDFGSGQNYLGRTLALPPYNRHVIAIERHHHNVEGAKSMDVSAQLAKKEKVLRNKKLYNLSKKDARAKGVPVPDTTSDDLARGSVASLLTEVDSDSTRVAQEDEITSDLAKGSMTYIERDLVDGHLEQVLSPVINSFEEETAMANEVVQPDPRREQSCDKSCTKSIAVSIHSCGNLTHHGLRSLVLNPSVVAVAMIGCCYNLLTERLGPATYKIPHLRSNHPRLEATSNAYDPHGFPMSKTFEDFEFDIKSTLDEQNPITSLPTTQRGKGVRLNITARMMAVQAPLNWTPDESAMFFTRHFYRALLQRLLFDRGVVKKAKSSDSVLVPGGSLTGKDEQGTPLIIGSLRKSAFTSFSAYVKAALEKLWADPEDGHTIKMMTEDLADDAESIKEYEQRFAYAKKHLSVIWSLMAFSAGVIESTIVVDRWLWLKEQTEVGEAWVETAFSYDQSPRNLVVVGIKKQEYIADGQ